VFRIRGHEPATCTHIDFSANMTYLHTASFVCDRVLSGCLRWMMGSELYVFGDCAHQAWTGFGIASRDRLIEGKA
jgi:hypothetical protein